MLKKFMKSQKNCLYDVAWGPISLLMLGAPILLVVMVIAGIVVAVVLINKSDKEKATHREEKEKNQGHDQ